MPDPRVLPRSAISWSGGKDSFAALARTRDTHDVVAAITMFDSHGARSRSHGLRPEVIAAQADRLGLESITARCEWQTYEDTFARTLEGLARRDVSRVIFGDILLDEHREWAEQICRRAGLTAVEPLWGLPTDQLFDEWIASGGEALIVTARTQFFDQSWLGRALTRDMAAEFDRLGVDRCGERGEYHTVVTNGHLFSSPVRLQALARVQRSDCWAIDYTVAE